MGEEKNSFVESELKMCQDKLRRCEVEMKFNQQCYGQSIQMLSQCHKSGLLGPYPGYHQVQTSLKPFVSLPAKTVIKNSLPPPFVPRSIFMSKPQNERSRNL